MTPSNATAKRVPTTAPAIAPALDFFFAPEEAFTESVAANTSILGVVMLAASVTFTPVVCRA